MLGADSFDLSNSVVSLIDIECAKAVFSIKYRLKIHCKNGHEKSFLFDDMKEVLRNRYVDVIGAHDFDQTYDKAHSRERSVGRDGICYPRIRDILHTTLGKKDTVKCSWLTMRCNRLQKSRKVRVRLFDLA